MAPRPLELAEQCRVVAKLSGLFVQADGATWRPVELQPSADFALSSPRTPSTYVDLRLAGIHNRSNLRQTIQATRSFSPTLPNTNGPNYSRPRQRVKLRVQNPLRDAERSFTVRRCDFRSANASSPTQELTRRFAWI